ncbi:MAG: hypothetical protein Q9168_008246 [Polycauliona sp. 1 TL-2023]
MSSTVLSATSSPAPYTLSGILAAVPRNLPWEQLQSYYHIAYNVDNIAQLLKHSPDPGCPYGTTERHLPGVKCPTPDVPVARAAILPIIEQTVELCRVWCAQNPEETDMIGEIKVVLGTICDYAGDDMVALELNLLKSMKQPGSGPPSTTPSDDSSHQSDEEDMPQMTTEQQKRYTGWMDTISTPEINIRICCPRYRLHTLRGLKRSELQRLVEGDLRSQGIKAPIQTCRFRGKWTVVYIRFANLEDAAIARVLWQPSRLGKGAFIMKTTNNIGVPPFLSSRAEAKGVAKKRSYCQEYYQEFFLVFNDENLKSRLANITDSQLKSLFEGYAKALGIPVSILECEKILALRSIRLRTTPSEDFEMMFWCDVGLEKVICSEKIS